MPFQHLIIGHVKMRIVGKINHHVSGRADVSQLLPDISPLSGCVKMLPAEIFHALDLPGDGGLFAGAARRIACGLKGRKFYTNFS